MKTQKTITKIITLSIIGLVVLMPGLVFAQFPCCIDMRGNVDGDIYDILDVADIVYMVDYQFRGGDAPPCFEEADVTGDGVIDIEDLACLTEAGFYGEYGCLKSCSYSN